MIISFEVLISVLTIMIHKFGEGKRGDFRFSLKVLWLYFQIIWRTEILKRLNKVAIQIIREMKRKQSEGRSGSSETIFGKGNLSELSISEIREFRNTDESLDAQQERELIREIHKNQTDEYGLNGMKVSSKMPSMKKNYRPPNICITEAQYQDQEKQFSTHSTNQDKLSFNKDIKRKKKTVQRVTKSVNMKGQFILPLRPDKIFNTPLSKAKIKTQNIENGRNSEIKPAKNYPFLGRVIPPSQLKTNLHEQSLPPVERTGHEENGKRIYHLMPDQIKFQLYDLTSGTCDFQINCLTGRNKEKTLDRRIGNERFSKKQCHSRDINFVNSSASSNGISEGYPTSIRTSFLASNSIQQSSVIEIKRQMSLDCKRSSFYSCKNVDSPYSRDSNSTATQVMLQSRHSKEKKKQWEYYNQFKRGS